MRPWNRSRRNRPPDASSKRPNVQTSVAESDETRSLAALLNARHAHRHDVRHLHDLHVRQGCRQGRFFYLFKILRASVASVASRRARPNLSRGLSWLWIFFLVASTPFARGSQPGGFAREVPGVRWRRAGTRGDARDGWNEFRSIRFVRTRVVVVVVAHRLTASTGSFQREITRALLEKLENVGFV